MIAAEVVADSINPWDSPLTTLALRYPRFIHSEFMTHRAFSRNASSSRAIPTKKLIEEVRDHELRASPIYWGKNRRGMQAVEELKHGFISDRWYAEREWDEAALDAANHAEAMESIGLHKQIVNRILEPFLHINVLVSATEWGNFFALRLHEDAQPEMRALAQAMKDALGASAPRSLKAGEWHLPYAPEDIGDIKTRIKVSVARCARVSYKSFETGHPSTIEEDIALHDRLLGSSPPHASPAEHQAMVSLRVDHDYQSNFHPTWAQYRKIFEAERRQRDLLLQ